MINKMEHHLLDEASKINVIVWKSQRISDRAVANQTTVRKTHVNWLWNKFNERQTLQNQWSHVTRSKAFTEQQEQMIKAVEEDKYRTAMEILNDANLNPNNKTHDSINRLLNINNLKARRAQKR